MTTVPLYTVEADAATGVWNHSTLVDTGRRISLKRLNGLRDTLTVHWDTAEIDGQTVALKMTLVNEPGAR